MGSFFSYGDLRLGQGRENSKAYLRENPTLAAQIETEIREMCGLPPKPESGETATPPKAEAGSEAEAAQAEKEEELVE